MKRSGFLALALATAMTLGCDTAPQTETEQPAGSSSAVGTGGEAANVSGADSEFVRELSMANQAEIELGKMAAERGMNAEVKKFGQMMVDDHTKAQQGLSSIAARHSIQTSAVLDDEHRELRDRLAELKGAEFDREYISAMVDGHEQVLDQLESRVDQETLADWRTRMSEQTKAPTQEKIEVEAVLPEKSDDPVTMSVNEWAAMAYPIVYQHHETAENLDETLQRGPRQTQ